MPAEDHAQSSRRTISTAAKGLVGVAAVAAAILMFFAIQQVSAAASLSFWLLGVLSFAGAFLAIRFPLLKLGSGGISFSLADGFVFAGLITLGPAAAALLAALEGLAANLRLRTRNPFRFCFNLSHNTLAIYGVGGVFYLIGGAPLSEGLSRLDPRFLISLLVLALVYAALSSGLVSLVATLAASRGPWALWTWLLRRFTPFVVLQAGVALALVHQSYWAIALAVAILGLSLYQLKTLDLNPPARA